MLDAPRGKIKRSQPAVNSRHFEGTDMTEDTIKRRARGLDRAFDILDFLKEIGQPLRPNEIASGIGSPKSTVYELVASLLERRILEPVGKDGHVYLGRQLYFLGQAHLRHFDLSREADHALQEIVSQTHETAQMCLLNGRKYTVALMKEGERHFRISSTSAKTRRSRGPHPGACCWRI
jgi:DNA-binding IclR family transcriptional regulator